MNEHGDPRLSQSLGEAEMIAVAMRQYEPSHVLDLATKDIELVFQLLPVSGETGVDNGDTGLVLDEVGVDHVRSDAMEMRGELHLSFPSSGECSSV
jgi:hypothetical protein